MVESRFCMLARSEATQPSNADAMLPVYICAACSVSANVFFVL